MRAIDRRATVEFGIPSLLLMENAGRAVANEVRKLKPRRVTLVCGSGNNGGDGFVAARHLANQGVRCTVVYFQRPSTPDARLNFHILQKMKVPRLRWNGRLRSADVIVDALFGTGLSRAVGEPYASAITAINGARRPVISIDIPSGMHADTGKPMGVCVRAAKTMTLGLPKRAFRRKTARAWTGRVVVADIGLPRSLL